MIKLVIFDLDGVIADSKRIHFEALNRALEENGEKPISYADHLHTFDGLPTKRKLDLLNLPANFVLRGKILKDKQRYTEEMLHDVEINPNIHQILEYLNTNDIMQSVASNAVNATCKLVLCKIPEFCMYSNHGEYFVSVPIFTPDLLCKSKPHPQLYLKAIALAGVTPSETLIVEDAPSGLEAAYTSGAHVLPVTDIYDFTEEKIRERIEAINARSAEISIRYEAPDLNILIPMAGAGARFQQAGYTFPKPLIEVHGKPMIQLVTENIGLKGHFIYIVQAEHYYRYNLQSLLMLISPGCDIVQVNEMTEGAACTALLAKDLINSEKSLLIANSDQYIEYDPMGFLYKARNYDGAILTFKATHPKWSFVKVENGYIVQVAEKKPISDVATAGVYYWNTGSDFVSCAEQMIAKNIRTNGEFYIAPAFNELIAIDGAEVIPYDIDRMWGLGTPEDLTYFMEHHG